MRVGISGTHGTGKTTLAEALCAHLPGHLLADEPYYQLEEQGYEFGFPPSREDYLVLLACSVSCLTAPPEPPEPPVPPEPPEPPGTPEPPGVVFDRTPLDYLAYLTATGADPVDQAAGVPVRQAFSGLDLLVITPITAETERVLPAADLPAFRTRMNDALLELVYGDPLEAWGDLPVLELTGPLDGRLAAVLAALGRSQYTQGMP